MPQSCVSCAHVLMADTALNGFRFGGTYFSHPSAERKMQHKVSYPLAHEDAVFCQQQDRYHKLRPWHLSVARGKQVSIANWKRPEKKPKA